LIIDVFGMKCTHTTSICMAMEYVSGNSLYHAPRNIPLKLV